ncbi:hypothetical protein ACWCP8_20710 [Streptomyces sp. NPDC002206]
MEYRAGQPQEEVGIDGCGLSSLARTFARCTLTSSYEFNHRAGPDADARVSKPGGGAAHKGTPPVPSTDPPPPALATAPAHRCGGMGAHAAAAVVARRRQSVFVTVLRKSAKGRSRSQGGRMWAAMTVIQDGAVRAGAVPEPATYCQLSDKFHIYGMSDMTDKQTISTFNDRSAAQPTSLRRKK